MKIYVFSTFLIIVSFISSCFAEPHVNEYHFETYTVHSHDGCQHISNDKVIAHKVPIGKGKKLVKRNAPLTEPFEGTFDCSKGTKAQCNNLKDALAYANTLFGSIFDFYVPIKVKLIITNNKKAEYIAQTAVPPYYTLRDPNNNQINAYISPLVKQLNLDIPIVFNDINDYDIKTTVKNKYLDPPYNIQPTIVHELLHGLGFTSNLKLVKGGVIGDRFPVYNRNNNYYMPKISIVKDDNLGKSTVKGFLPLNMLEKNFVDYDDQTKYYFDNVSFNNICENELEYDIHDPIYASEKAKLNEFSLELDQWNGMEQGMHFYERSHVSLSVGFKTHDGRVIPISTYDNAEDSDLCHLTPANFRSKNKHDSKWGNKIDQNFILYPMNVDIELSNEEKIRRYGNGKTVGILSEDIISILETMGYQRRGTPINNTIYQVQTHIPVDNSETVVDGDEDVKTGENLKSQVKSFAVQDSPILTKVILMTVFTLIFIQLSFF